MIARNLGSACARTLGIQYDLGVPNINLADMQCWRYNFFPAWAGDARRVGPFMHAFDDTMENGYGSTALCENLLATHSLYLFLSN
jgi:hypothetical protein